MQRDCLNVWIQVNILKYHEHPSGARRKKTHGTSAARLNANNYRIFQYKCVFAAFGQMFVRWLVRLFKILGDGFFLNRVDLSLSHRQCCCFIPFDLLFIFIRVHRLKSFRSGCKSLDLNASIYVLYNNQTENISPRHFVFAHIYFTISSHWLICVRFVHLWLLFVAVVIFFFFFCYSYS